MTTNLVHLLLLEFNIGCGRFSCSTVKRKINSRSGKSAISRAWKLWNKGGGRLLAGLARRRNAEVALYFNDLVSPFIPG